MVNTYGFHSINSNTFNMLGDLNLYYEHNTRNYVITGLRINNALFNILGYIPGVSFFSGCARMTIGLGLIVSTLISSERNNKIIIGRWNDEALATGIVQITRGALEALIPYGRVINAILDVIATPFNFLAEKNQNRRLYRLGENIPYPDVNYPLPFQILKLA